MRIAGGTAALAVLAVVLFSWSSGRTAFAEVTRQLNEADSLTWTRTTVERFYSEDGNRTWLRTRKSTWEYKHPGRYRRTQHDEDGSVTRVTIIDRRRGESLRLDMKSKKTLRPPSVEIEPGARRPFEWVSEMLRSEPMEFVGRETINEREVNVVRFPHATRSRDIWIDPKSKQFVGWTDPGADQIDLLNLPDKDNPPEEKFSKGTMLGGFTNNIKYDAVLDDGLFSVAPPDGFEVVEYALYPTVTEPEMIEWLGILARVNGDTFPDTIPWQDFGERFNAAQAKDESDRTEPEQRLIDTYYKHAQNQNTMPIRAFLNDETVLGSFRYLGKGVRVGSTDQIVCWYRLKGSGKYQAVFGNLIAKEVQPSELPIPVGPE